MNRKKVKEIENFNLFQTMDSLEIDLGIFDFISPSLLDLYYKTMFGERFLSNIFIDNTITEVAQIIDGFYTTKWNSLLAYITSKNNALTGNNPYSEKLSETIVDTGEVETNRTTTNSVSAYNDENFVNNDEDTTNETTDYNELTKTRTQYIDKLSPETLNNVVSYLTQNYVYDTIFTDVNNIITLCIFSF